MPTYEYQCDKCGCQFEAAQSIKEKPLTICPETLCKLKKWGKGRVKRLISAGAGLLFKGSGFYTTDYRSENYKQAAKKEAPPAAPSDSKTGPAKADTQSAGKPEAKPVTKSEGKASGSQSTKT